jgi:hypothetical protein
LFRNRKVPRPKLAFDDILKPALKKQESKRDRFEEDIMKAILEKGEDDTEDKPLELFSESLKGYVKDIKELQNGGSLTKKATIN